MVCAEIFSILGVAATVAGNAYNFSLKNDIVEHAYFDMIRDS